MLRASCLTLEIKKCRCHEVKIEESEKADNRWESNPAYLRLSMLSDRAWLKPEARGILGLTPGNCRPFHFPLFYLITSKFI